MREIVVYGPPLAGKRTLLEAAARASGTELEAFRAGEGEDGIWDRGLSLLLPSHSARARTISGGVWNRSSWPGLLEEAAVVVVVLDPQSERMEANTDVLAKVASLARQPVGCCVFSKGDLPETRPFMTRLEAALSGRIAHWPRFTTSFRSGATLGAPLDWALAQLGPP